MPQALWNYLLLLGWQPNNEQALLTKWTVRKQFRLADISSDPVVFDWQKLRMLNQRYLQKMSVHHLAGWIRDFLEDAYGALPASERWLVDLTDSIRDELVVLEDVIELTEWAFDTPEPTPIARQLLRSVKCKAVLNPFAS